MSLYVLAGEQPQVATKSLSTSLCKTVLQSQRPYRNEAGWRGTFPFVPGMSAT